MSAAVPVLVAARVHEPLLELPAQPPVPVERQGRGRDAAVHDAAVPHGVLELLIAGVDVPVHVHVVVVAVAVVLAGVDDAAHPPAVPPGGPAAGGREPRLGEAEGRQEVEQRRGDAAPQPGRGAFAGVGVGAAAAADEGQVLRVAGAVAAVQRQEEVEGEGVEEGGDCEREEEELFAVSDDGKRGGGRALTKERNSDMVRSSAARRRWGYGRGAMADWRCWRLKWDGREGGGEET
jgi:hypothetical protein